MRPLLILLRIEQDVLYRLVYHVLRVAIETLAIDERGGLGGGACGLGIVEKLRGGILLQELLSLDLKEVGAAHLLIARTVLVLHRTRLMRLQNILLACFDALFE